MKEWTRNDWGYVVYPMGVKLIIKDLIKKRLDEVGLTTAKGYSQRIMWKSAYISRNSWYDADEMGREGDLVIWVNMSYYVEKEKIKDAWRASWETERITFRFGPDVIRDYKLNELLG